VSSSERAQKVSFECLDCTFGVVRAFLFGWVNVVGEFLRDEEIEKGGGLLIVEDLNFEFVAMGTERTGTWLHRRHRDGKWHGKPSMGSTLIYPL
jgi:hypothetical protein